MYYNSILQSNELGIDFQIKSKWFLTLETSTHFKKAIYLLASTNIKQIQIDSVCPLQILYYLTKKTVTTEIYSSAFYKNFVKATFSLK